MTSTCQPTTVLVGDAHCLDLECDHEHTAEGGPNGLEESYCDEVREETVCATHTAPWPCTQPTAPAALPPSGA
ncbi:hypothetical protein [Streptomyces bangladeshensis]|uniref:Uncharacterized protein n=1 Tax=Streptomyces bangladeshensis TaxID=295352 RepID=A0ABP5NJZ6_9ACTN